VPPESTHCAALPTRPSTNGPDPPKACCTIWGGEPHQRGLLLRLAYALGQGSRINLHAVVFGGDQRDGVGQRLGSPSLRHGDQRIPG
jgi:hypothetical protein